MNVIETNSLRKSYGAQEVLHGIDLRVRKGRLVGFLGPNGAGKSTTIRILLGLIRASAGSALINGQDSRRRGRAIRADVGYLPGEVRFYPSLTGRATLNFYARARRRSCADEIGRLAELFDLNLDKRTRAYSSGMKQKLGLIQALMHQPELLILDEPTTGLDPLVRKSVFAELRRVVNTGRTILFSSHSLGEVEELCDDVIILREGRVIEQEEIGILQQRALRRVTIIWPSAEAIPAPLPARFQLIERDTHVIRGNWSGSTPSLIDWLSQLQLDDVTIEPPDLEDLFLTYYDGSAARPTEMTPPISGENPPDPSLQQGGTS